MSSITGSVKSPGKNPADGVTDPVPWLGWTEVTRAGISSEEAEGEAVK